MHDPQEVELLGRSSSTTCDSAEQATAARGKTEFDQICMNYLIVLQIKLAQGKSQQVMLPTTP